MIECVIPPLLFVLVMEMIFRCTEVNTNEITCPSMKVFMDNITLVAESRSHIKQLVTRLQELIKWAARKIKPSKCLSLLIIKGNCREKKFSIDMNEIPSIRDKRVKSIGWLLQLPTA